jgi:hypothetical protein
MYQALMEAIIKFKQSETHSMEEEGEDEELQLTKGY